MANHSVNITISTFTSNSMKDENKEALVVTEPILRPRPHLKKLPKLEEIDGKYKEVILTLPKEEGWAISALRQYKGFWCSQEMLPGILAMESSYKSRPNDVIVASFLKSGTTWLKALTFAIVHRNKYAFSSHPFFKLNPHDCVPLIEFHYAVGDEQYLETLPSPRVLGTHLPYSLLPENIKASQCPIIYICREPKDVVVSLWHMIAKFDWIEKSFSLNQLFELFCEGRVPKGPIWDHVLEYYTEDLYKTDKILLLKYEEMMKDPSDGVMKIAKFVGYPFSEEEIENGVVKDIIELCSFDKLKDYDINKNGVGNQTNKYFFRKAVVGDWHNNITTEMAAKLDEITRKKFHHSCFTNGAQQLA